MQAAYGDLAEEASALVKHPLYRRESAHDERPARRRRKVVVRIWINALCDAHALSRRGGVRPCQRKGETPWKAKGRDRTSLNGVMGKETR